MQSPLLPWEVIERMIGHSGDHPELLHSFSLTCHNLRPRALCLLVANFSFKSRVKIFDFCDFLRAKPHLKPLVSSVTADPRDFAPVPLFDVVPNLSEITLAASNSKEDPPRIILNRFSLTCFQRLGTHIHTLRLFHLSFPTYLEFARVFSAFTNIIHLACMDVIIEAEGGRGPLEVVKRRLSEKLRLTTLIVGISDRIPRESYYDTLSVGSLLLDSGLAQSTVESLTLQGVYRSRRISQLSGWPRLQHLTLKLFNPQAQDITDSIMFLKDFLHVKLKDVVVELHSDDSFGKIASDLFHDAERVELYKELGQTLLRFSNPRVAWISAKPLRAGRVPFWTQELGTLFPALSQSRAVTVLVTPRMVVFPHDGHDGVIEALVASPDGKWVASGSGDSIIMLWDAAGDGVLVQQWVAHDYSGVLSLAFSPDSRYLVSGGNDGTVMVWDLTHCPGSRELVATMQGHSAPIASCAWSPDGDTIASGTRNNAVCLWDAHTFQRLHTLTVKKAGTSIELQFTLFSPNGRCLVAGSHGSYCRQSYSIWDVASSTPAHKTLQTCCTNWASGHFVAAAFDPRPGSTRVAIAVKDGAEILDVESGRRLFFLPTRIGDMMDLAFSPDGKLLFTVAVALDMNYIMKTWDASTGAKLQRFVVNGNKRRVFRARFSPCGKYIATVLGDRTVQLCRTTDGSCAGIFHLSENQQSVVKYLSCSPDGRILSFGGEDGTVVIQRIDNIFDT